MAKHDSPTPRPAQDPERFKHLPEPINPKDLITGQETEPPPDPEGGRNTDTDFLLRYGAGGV
jgi:hypothetical protein